ncbi:unnamed protein product, partial [Polarella glacialis]
MSSSSSRFVLSVNPVDMGQRLELSVAEAASDNDHQPPEFPVAEVAQSLGLLQSRLRNFTLGTIEISPAIQAERHLSAGSEGRVVVDTQEAKGASRSPSPSPSPPEPEPLFRLFLPGGRQLWAWRALSRCVLCLCCGWRFNFSPFQSVA